MPFFIIFIVSSVYKFNIKSKHMVKSKQFINISSNVSWTVQKGSWMIQIIVTVLISMLFTQLFGSNLGLQVSTIFYNICSFIFFHWIIGDPFDTAYKECTFWEQMAIQLEDSSTLTFMALYPVLFFMFVHRMVVWNTKLFYIACISLTLVVIPKLGFMHMKRVFGIKRYD